MNGGGKRYGEFPQMIGVKKVLLEIIESLVR